VATFLATPTSANLRAVVTDETGSGALVFATSPSLVTPAIGSGGFTIAGATSGSTSIVATAAASGVLTLPSATDTLVGRATADTLTNKTISGASNTLTSIANGSLTNSSVTINGSAVSLGGSIVVTANTTNALTIGSGLSGTSFNGSAAVTIANAGVLSLAASGTGISVNAATGAITITSNATSANTASAIVARDASGNFSAGTITAALSGNASTATTATNLSGGSVSATTGSFSGRITGTAALTSGGIANATGSLGAVEVQGGGGTNAAFMAFHRPGAYATYFGLDSDNVFKVGGWSMGALAYSILHSGNYNSYAPSLTGSGASGSWGISVTGNAANITAYTVNQNLGTGNNVTFNAVNDAAGNLRDVPQNAKSAAYTLVSGDAGKHVSITTGGVTVPASVFSAGQVITVYNNAATSQTITQGASVTIYLAGTATTGNRTLAQRGLATLLCVAANTFVISGSGVS
jgi:hypothetical protein